MNKTSPLLILLALVIIAILANGCGSPSTDPCLKESAQIKQLEVEINKILDTSIQVDSVKVVDKLGQISELCKEYDTEQLYKRLKNTKFITPITSVVMPSVLRDTSDKVPPPPPPLPVDDHTNGYGNGPEIETDPAQVSSAKPSTSPSGQSFKKKNIKN